MRVLIVEDSKRLQRSLQRGLRRAGYLVDGAEDGEEGLFLAQTNAYDVIVLDLMLPKMDGSEVLTALRAGGDRTHVLVLTARDTVADRVAGLEGGADDYLIKPFAFDELLARVGALARRSYGVKTPLLRVGELSIDTSSKRVTLAGGPVELKPREYALLEYLAMRRGEVVSRTEIEEHIYDERVAPMSNVVDSAICQLRRKIDLPGRDSLIRTRRGLGYVLEDRGE